MALLIVGSGFLAYHLALEATVSGWSVCIVGRTSGLRRRRRLVKDLSRAGIDVYSVGEVSVESISRVLGRCGAQVLVYTIGAMSNGAAAWDAHVYVWREVLEAVRSVELDLVVYVSAAVVSPCESVFEEAEASPDRAWLGTGFAKSKAEGEKLGLHYLREHGVPVSIVRPVMMFGPYASHAEHRLLGLAARLRIALHVDVDVVPVRDVAKAILFLSSKPGAAKGRWFYIARPEGFTLTMLSERLACKGGFCLRGGGLPLLARFALAVGWPTRLSVLGSWLHCGWRFRPEGLTALGFKGWVSLDEAVEEYASWLFGRSSL